MTWGRDHIGSMHWFGCSGHRVEVENKFGGWCRGTFVGQKYGPFNDIPAVWDKFFGSKGYKALAAGIAGALATTSSSHVLSRPL